MRDSLIHLLHFYSPAFHHISDDPQGRNHCHIWMHSLKLSKNQIFTHYVGKSWYRPIYMQIPTQHSLNSYKYHSIIWNNYTSSKQFKRNNSWKCWLQMIIKKNKMLITCIIQEFLQRLDFRMKRSNFFLLHVNWFLKTVSQLNNKSSKCMVKILKCQNYIQ